MMQAYVVLGGATLQSHDSSVPLALLPTDGWMDGASKTAQSLNRLLHPECRGGGDRVFHIAGKTHYIWVKSCAKSLEMSDALDQQKQCLY